MFKKLITSIALFFSIKKENKTVSCGSKEMNCKNYGTCTNAWDNRCLGASAQHVKRASQAQDDALQDALGLPRKKFKDQKKWKTT